MKSVAVVGGKYRVLDLTDQHVREGVRTAKSATELYESDLALDFEVAA